MSAGLEGHHRARERAQDYTPCYGAQVWTGEFVARPVEYLPVPYRHSTRRAVVVSVTVVLPKFTLMPEFVPFHFTCRYTIHTVSKWL